MHDAYSETDCLLLYIVLLNSNSMEHLQSESELFVSQITTEVALVDIKLLNNNKAAGKNHPLTEL